MRLIGSLRLKIGSRGGHAAALATRGQRRAANADRRITLRDGRIVADEVSPCG